MRFAWVCPTVSRPCPSLDRTRLKRRKVRPCPTVSRPCPKIAVSRVVAPLFSFRKEGPDTVFGHGQNGQKTGHGLLGNAQKNRAGHGLDTGDHGVKRATVSEGNGTRSERARMTDRVPMHLGHGRECWERSGGVVHKSSHGRGETLTKAYRQGEGTHEHT